MKWRKWLKVIVFVLLPVNAWLAVLLYLHNQKRQVPQEMELQARREQTIVTKYMQKKYGFQVGQSFRLSFPHAFIGSPPPLGRGYPVCFLNVGATVSEEIWRPAITEALMSSNYLHVVLVCYPPPFERQWNWLPVRQFIQKLNNPRLSALVGNWQLGKVWGQPGAGGILLILCDGGGIIRAIEPYPRLKISPYWEEEVSDWRPKLHQAVKKVLDKFFRGKRG